MSRVRQFDTEPFVFSVHRRSLPRNTPDSLFETVPLDPPKRTMVRLPSFVLLVNPLEELKDLLGHRGNSRFLLNYHVCSPVCMRNDELDDLQVLPEFVVRDLLFVNLFHVVLRQFDRLRFVFRLNDEAACIRYRVTIEFVCFCHVQSASQSSAAAIPVWKCSAICAVSSLNCSKSYSWA